MAVFAGRRDPALAVPAATLPARERRSDERYVSVMRLGKLSAPRDEFVLIRDISAGGMHAEIFSRRRLGERLTLDLGNEDPMTGKIVRLDDAGARIEFERRIDMNRTLARVAPPGRRRARAPRVNVGMSISVMRCHARTSCLLIDVSQGGGKFRTDVPMKVGDEVTLEIRGFGKIMGQVRWVLNGVVGTAFPFQLPYRKLASWIATINQQRGG